MSVTRDLNLGTLVPIMVWLLGASVAGVWWASTLTSSVSDIRSWQIRQDSRLEVLEQSQATATAQNARTQAILEIIRQEVRENNALLLEELRNNIGNNIGNNMGNVQ